MEFTNDQLIALVKSLARAMVRLQAEVDSMGVCLAGRGIVWNRQDIYANYEGLLALLERDNPADVVREFERRFPNQ